MQIKNLIISAVFAQVALVAAPSVSAQQSAESADEAQDVDEALGEEKVDVQGSLADIIGEREATTTGDLRGGYLFAGESLREFEIDDRNIFRTRWRVRSTWRFGEDLRVVGRIAGLCSTEECSPDFILQPELPGRTSIKDGQITIDELFFHWFRTDRFDVALGRMQSKFVSRGGVFSKSLDRNDSNNLRINWTDGLHATYKARNGWVSHLILQYNSEDGPSTVRRPPLSFDSDDSRVSYHAVVENVQHKRLLIQRTIGLSYLPSSLQHTVAGSEARDDYTGIVGRMAHRWPKRDDRWRIRSSLEAGYAPTTPSRATSGVTGDGEAGGLAWAVTVSLMDFQQGHSIGVNYARTEAGWLLSPQYGSNEELYEVRYVWKPTSRFTLDVRGRWRDELVPLLDPDPSRDRFDMYARFTWSFTIRD